MEWQDKVEVRSGNIGEEYVKDALIRNGYTIYTVVSDGPHPFDMIAIKNKTTYLVEVKTKPSMEYHPATGLNTNSFKKYIDKCNEYNTDMILVFVDWKEEKVYSGKLRDLIKPRIIEGKQYPNLSIAGPKITLFHRSQLDEWLWCNVDWDELKSLSKSNYI